MRLLFPLLRHVDSCFPSVRDTDQPVDQSRVIASRLRVADKAHCKAGVAGVAEAGRGAHTARFHLLFS